MPKIVEVDEHQWDTEPAASRGIANAAPELATLDNIRSGKVGFSFSGGGFLLPYYLGSIQALTQLGLLQPGVTHVGGSSAGSLAAAIITARLPHDEVLASVKGMMESCRQTGVWRRLGPGLKASLEKLLPEDAHIRCSGTTHIAITKVKPYGALRSKRVTSFSSRSDLIDALLASCHLPVLSDGSVTTRFRGRRVIDGGITDLMPVPPQPEHVVKITCIPLDSLKRMPMKNRAINRQYIAISPCRFRVWPYDHSQTVNYMLSPGPDEVVEWLMEAGKQDIASWAHLVGLTLSEPLRSLAITDVDTFPLRTSTSGSRPQGKGSAVAAAPASGKGYEGAKGGKEADVQLTDQEAEERATLGGQAKWLTEEAEAEGLTKGGAGGKAAAVQQGQQQRPEQAPEAGWTLHAHAEPTRQ